MSVLEYKCPHCGGALVFDSGTQKMLCPFCDSSFDVEALRQHDENLKSLEQENINWDDLEESDWKRGELEDMILFSCSSCGGEIMGDKSTVAKSCPYCGNTAIMTKQVSGVLRPDCIIPFKLDKNAAKKALTGFYNGKPLLPGAFRSQNSIDSITGIYVPFWLFDCDAHAAIQYKATRVHMWSDSKYNYVKTDHYELFREGDISFERVPVDGSAKMDDSYMDAIEPFDYSAAVDFQTAFLSGFVADKYDVDCEQSKPRANDRIKASTEDAFSETVAGYSTCIPQKASISIEDGKIRYALLPVWMLNTKYNGKTYTFAMNGQTGRFIGALPIHWGKFWLYLTGISALLSTLGILVINLMF
ncbi:MAG: hypothetical protein LBU32_03390 [Clostridiales bacterium]|nr:hypothetical protein [Clostridiales bacterium]